MAKQIINNTDEMKKYYDENGDRYYFQDAEFMFDVEVDSNIDAWTIKGKSLKAKNIDCDNINLTGNLDITGEIDAENITVKNLRATDVIALDIKTNVLNCINKLNCKSLNAKHVGFKQIDCGSMQVTGSVNWGKYEMDLIVPFELDEE